MKTICIKTNNLKALNYLLENFKKIELDDIYFSCHKFNIYNNIFIHYKGDNINTFFNLVSNILAFLVLDIYEDNITNKILQNEYFYFDSLEREDILNIFRDICLENIEDFEIRETLLLDCFNSFFKQNHFHENICSFYLNGFITFRLKSYISKLEQMIDTAVNRYLIEKEYTEFVSLLKIYVNSEKSKTDLVHLVYRCEGKNMDSFLLDKNKHIIKTDINLLNAKYLSDISFSASDMILNTLLNILPKKIYVHLHDEDDEDEFISTLELIFEGRIVICSDLNVGVKSDG